MVSDYLATDYGVRCDASDLDNNTLLHMMSFRGSVLAVQWLLDEGFLENHIDRFVIHTRRFCVLKDGQ